MTAGPDQLPPDWLRLAPDEVLVIESDVLLDQDQVERLHEVLGPGRAVVLGPGVRIAGVIPRGAT